jgi:hypothetical protein
MGKIEETAHIWHGNPIVGFGKDLSLSRTSDHEKLRMVVDATPLIGEKHAWISLG